MANTITTGAGGISIAFDGSTAWDSTVLYSDGLMIDSLALIPSGATDTILIREGSATGRIIASLATAATTDRPIVYINSIGRNVKPYVVGNEASASCQLIINLR